MNTETMHCQSCGMTIAGGAYCAHCVDENGELQGFDERIAGMTQFMKTRDPELTDDAAAAQALSYMATMPAWRNHPRFAAE